MMKSKIRIVVWSLGWFAWLESVVGQKSVNSQNGNSERELKTGTQDMTFAYLKTVENIGKSGEIEDLGFLGKF